MHKTKLNLGCGNNPLSGYINFDKYSEGNNIFYCDLEKLPLPFDDNSIDEIRLHHVLEHLNIPAFEFMLEMYRILKKNGIIDIKLPTNCYILTHIRYHHSKIYFESICDTNKNIKSGQRLELFEVISIKGKIKSIFSFFWRIKQFLEGMLYGEFQYKFKKL